MTSSALHDAVRIRACVDAAFERHPDPTGRLLNVLNDVQEGCRFLPEEAIELIAERMDVPVKQIVQMGEFFSYLSLDPVGRCVIEVCDGTACHTQGSLRLVAEFEKKLGINVGQTTEDGLVTLRTVGCVGACGIAPVVVADGDAYGRVRVMQVGDIAQVVYDRAQEAQAAEESEAANGEVAEGAAIADGKAAEGAATAYGEAADSVEAANGEVAEGAASADGAAAEGAATADGEVAGSATRPQTADGEAAEGVVAGDGDTGGEVV